MKYFGFKMGSLITAIAILAGCGGGVPGPLPGAKCVPEATNATINLSWAANRDADVNRAGGGYRVYHSTELNFVPGDPGVTEIDVPYASGPTAPTSTTFNVTQTCEHYFKAQAYSALNPGSFLTEPLVVLVPN